MDKLLCCANHALRAKRRKKRNSLDNLRIYLGKRRLALERGMRIEERLSKRMPGEVRLEIRKQIVVDINKSDQFVIVSTSPEVLESVRLVAYEEREDRTLILAKTPKENREGCKGKRVYRP